MDWVGTEAGEWSAVLRLRWARGWGRRGESEQDQLIEVIVGDLRHAPKLPEQHDPLSVGVKGLAITAVAVVVLPWWPQP
jgi:hypothetical protein